MSIQRIGAYAPTSGPFSGTLAIAHGTGLTTSPRRGTVQSPYIGMSDLTVNIIIAGPGDITQSMTVYMGIYEYDTATGQPTDLVSTAGQVVIPTTVSADTLFSASVSGTLTPDKSYIICYNAAGGVGEHVDAQVIPTTSTTTSLAIGNFPDPWSELAPGGAGTTTPVMYIEGEIADPKTPDFLEAPLYTFTSV